MRRVASMPFMLGMAISITTTSGLLILGQLQRLPAVGRFAHHDKSGLPLQQQAHAVAQDVVIVSQQYANGFIAMACSYRPRGPVSISTRAAAVRAQQCPAAGPRVDLESGRPDA